MIQVSHVYKEGVSAWVASVGWEVRRARQLMMAVRAVRPKGARAAIRGSQMWTGQDIAVASCSSEGVSGERAGTGGASPCRHGVRRRRGGGSRDRGVLHAP